MHSHGQLPVADRIDEDIYRVYFAARSAEQVSGIGYVEIDIRHPEKILAISKEPVLSPGPIGHFDQFGVFPGAIIDWQGKKFLYYIGWVRGYTAPLFYAAIGLAVSDDNGRTFERYSPAPILSRDEHDPCLVTSPHVFLDDNVLKMHYVSGVKWEQQGDQLQSYYHIKFASSVDGIQWYRQGRVAIDFRNDRETNIARAAVIREADTYKMWYSYVADGIPYRMGYAESGDCKHWERKDDEVGLDRVPGEFDDEMQCYPNVIVHKNKKYLFYNGNNFGTGGFGLAVEA